MQKYIVIYDTTQQSCNSQNNSYIILTSYVIFLAKKLNSILIKLYTLNFKPYIYNCAKTLVSQSAQPELSCLNLNDRQMSLARLINVQLKPRHCNLETMQCKNETSESLCNPMSTSTRTCQSNKQAAHQFLIAGPKCMKLSEKKQGMIVTICLALLNPIKRTWRVHVGAVRLKNASGDTGVEEPSTVCFEPANVLCSLNGIL